MPVGAPDNPDTPASGRLASRLPGSVAKSSSYPQRAIGTASKREPISSVSCTASWIATSPTRTGEMSCTRARRAGPRAPPSRPGAVRARRCGIHRRSAGSASAAPADDQPGRPPGSGCASRRHRSATGPPPSGSGSPGPFGPSPDGGVRPRTTRRSWSCSCGRDPSARARRAAGRSGRIRIAACARLAAGWLIQRCARIWAIRTASSTGKIRRGRSRSGAVRPA